MKKTLKKTTKTVFKRDTLAKNKIIYPKNVRAKVAMDFTSDKYSAPRTIETRLKVNPRPRVECFKIRLRPCQVHV